MKNFVFTSAGDNTSFQNLWVAKEGQVCNYDIFVIYYGNDADKYKIYESKVKFIERRQGSKFQNFFYFFQTYRSIIEEYDYFFILDDDIVLNVSQINEMFHLAKTYKLDICGPSFLRSSKITYSQTIQKDRLLLEYTNFVEVNTPLFNKKALYKLMSVYNPCLIGWGIDYLYIWCNGSDKRKSYAIIHKIGCINPRDEQKGVPYRELDLIPHCDKRESIWLNFAKNIGCPQTLKVITYGSVPIAKSMKLINELKHQPNLRL